MSDLLETPLAPTAVKSGRYLVAPGHSVLILGKIFRNPDVLPAWFVDHDGGLAGRLDRKALTETSLPCNREVTAPTPRTESDPAPEMGRELIRLQRENNEIATGNRDLVGQLAAMTAQSNGRIRTLAQQADAVAHWELEAEKAQARVKELEAKVAELEAALDAAKTVAAKPAKSR